VSHGLVGSRVRRLDMPLGDVLAITLATAHGKEVLVARLSGNPRGIGLVDERPKGAPANAFVQRLRKLLEGSAVERGVAFGRDGARLDLVRGDERVRLFLAPGAEAWRIAVVADDDRVLASAGRGPLDIEASASAPLERDALRASGETLIGGALFDAEAAARSALGRALKKALARLDRRLEAIGADVERADEAPSLRGKADLILAHAHAYEAGSDRLDVLDYRDDPPVARAVPIDPTKGARGTAEGLYRRARRLERGRAMAEERRRATAAERGIVESFVARLEAAHGVEAIGTIAEEAARKGVRGAREAMPREGTSGGGRKKPAERLPYRAFECAGGNRVLVGRGSADNDALTLHHARPYDLWLHARGLSGAHVVVPLTRGKTCPPDLLADAAMLAAHFSDARGEPLVEVIHVARRHVRKPKGAPAGLVRVEREKVIAVRVVPDRLAALLARELH
jgi:predicted ribosome quality control (RQC) complex YloA/Tae2 family protein